MKKFILCLAIALAAVCALYAPAETANVLAPLAVLAIAVVFVAATAQTVRRSRRSSLTSAINVAEGTHMGALTKFADAALATRFLLVKFGSDVDHVAINTDGDMPLGVVPDEVATADLATLPVAVQLLGISKSTLKCVASEAIAITDELYTADGGKVQDLPAGAGTYYKIGRPLQAAAADGDVIEFEPCYPVAVTVS